MSRRLKRSAFPNGLPPSMPRGTLTLAILLGLGFVGGLVVHFRTSPRSGQEPPTLAVGRAAPVPRQQAAPADDARLREGIVGTWQDFYQGKRTLTIHSDGTATMVVELSGWKARLFTSRLRLDLVWSVKDGKMLRRTVGGEPADKVEYVNRRVGDRCAEPVLELTADRMVLLDQNGQQRYDWRRVRY